RLARIPDPLPEDLVAAESLPSFDPAIRAVHFPESQEDLASARERLKFDELFTLELGVAFRKHRVEAGQRGVAHETSGPLVERLLTGVPFEPTRAQRRAMQQVGDAMARPRPMNALLQGDVSSGKTLVALYAALVAIQSGHHAAIMAPTEVLAGQHFRSMTELLGPFGAVSYLELADGPTDGQASLLESQTSTGGPGVSYALLSASVTGKDRTRILDGIDGGDVDLVVGTHALVQEGVSFLALSLAVI